MNQQIGNTSSAFFNEEGARILRFKDPIDKTVKHLGKSYTIIGVTKNMHVNSPGLERIHF